MKILHPRCTSGAAPATELECDMDSQSISRVAVDIVPSAPLENSAGSDYLLLKPCAPEYVDADDLENLSIWITLNP